MSSGSDEDLREEERNLKMEKEEDVGVSDERVGATPKPGRLVIIEPVLTMYLSLYSVFSPLTSQYSMSVFNARFNVTGSNTSACGVEEVYSSTNLNRQAAQAAGANYQLALDLSQGVPTLFIAIILGSCTDTWGRKIGLILPSISGALECLIFIIQQVAALPLEFTYLGSLIDGFMGSDTIMVGTCYAYLTDVTTVDNRSFRILVAEMVQNAVKGVLHLVTGYVIAALGFLYSYIMLLGFYVIMLLYIIFLVPETRDVSKKQKISKRVIVDPFKMVFGAKGKGYRSLLLIGLTGLVFLCLGQQGQFSIENLYLLNTPLCWGPLLISYWKFTRIVLQCLTYLLVVKVLLRVLSDAPIVLLSAISSIAYCFFFAFVSKTWMAFSALVIGFGAKQNLPMSKSMLSKLVSTEQQGSFMSVVHVIEKCFGLVGNIIFTQVYAASLLFFKGTVYICFGAITCIGVFFISAFHHRLKKTTKRSAEANETTKL